MQISGGAGILVWVLVICWISFLGDPHLYLNTVPSHSSLSITYYPARVFCDLCASLHGMMADRDCANSLFDSSLCHYTLTGKIFSAPC